MVSRANTLTFCGIEVVDVSVQVHMSSGLPAFIVVGLPDKTIAESKERVRAALSSIGLNLPSKRITVNLAPADLLKEGSHFDLAIAVGLLISMNILPEEELYNYLILGELALDATVLPVSGVLPAAIGANAREKGIICPKANSGEAAWSGNQNILPLSNIIALINHFKGSQIIAPPEIKDELGTEIVHYQDMYDVKGQEVAKRALEVAASGNHNMLMRGPPGTGKSMLAQRLAGILPKMSVEEILECSTIYSIAGMIEGNKLQAYRPFRSPHHSCSVAAMVGGGFGRRVTPGEISLAHNGVLFLDELPEFPRAVLDSLRQPIESGNVMVARVSSHVTFPAKFQLVAAMNPCRCGYYGYAADCGRAPRCALDYQARVSGPIFDRIDIHVELGQLAGHELQAKDQLTSTEVIAGRVERARSLQQKRYAGHGIRTNSELNGKLLEEFATPDSDGQELLNKAVDKIQLSMRSYNKVLRVARTIADLEDKKSITKSHIAEALHYNRMAEKM